MCGDSFHPNWAVGESAVPIGRRRIKAEGHAINVAGVAEAVAENDGSGVIRWQRGCKRPAENYEEQTPYDSAQHSLNRVPEGGRVGNLSGVRTVITICATLFACGAIAFESSTQAAQGVLRRTFPKIAGKFVFRDLKMDSSGSDAYEIEAKNGKVYVSGTSATAMCRGAYQYLKDEFDSIATWEGIRLGEPKRVSEEEEREREEQGRIEIEDMPKRRVVCPVRYRHYFNVCTFGYTTAFWDWARWEKEIDWMALHGINMPLAMNAQEAIWQRVWKSYGFTQQQIDGFFAGPAFLPWHRMGNINAHCGPLPQRWHEGQVALQRKILERERALGMKPVVPAFSGFVPPSFSSRFPQAEVLRNAEWAGFEPTFLLSPRDKMFREIGAAFIREYTNEFGTDHLYLADVFNEMTPQVSEKTKLEDLEAAGRAVYDAIAAGDPNGVWVMQGWLFLNDRGFWGAPEVEAFLKPVPNDKMIIIDLACDQYEVWRTQPAVRNKQWIWCVLHNFGGNTAMSGNLKLY